jgi:MFS family permease
MSSDPKTKTSAADLGHAGLVKPPSMAQTDGLQGLDPVYDPAEKRVDEIEMIGEEEAAGLTPAAESPISPAMRYLHISRTIHQLVTDRNRAVGVYLAVASLLWTASSALLNVTPKAHLMVPIEHIQRWCLPATFAILTILALFVGLLLIRTRIGLLYEVAKMNALLGLPIGRVQRVNFLSIFFLMHLLISLAGGGTGALFSFHILYEHELNHSTLLVVSIIAGVSITLFLILLYIGTVLSATADKKLQGRIQ